MTASVTIVKFRSGWIGDMETRQIAVNLNNIDKLTCADSSRPSVINKKSRFTTLLAEYRDRGGGEEGAVRL